MLVQPMPTVVLACNRLGVGGTERGMATQALAIDRERFDVRVLGVHDTGPWGEALTAAGLRVDVAGGSLDKLVGLLSGVDLVVHLRPGAQAPLLPAACRCAGVPSLVEWNIFGQVDRSPDRDRFACRLFTSKATQIRYRRRVGDRSAAFHDRHRVQHLPVDPTLRQRAPDARMARRRLGLDPDRPVVGRVGRAVDAKWRRLLVDMTPFLLDAVPEAQLLFAGPTRAKIRRLRRLGTLDRCTLIEHGFDDDRLAACYAACDVIVSASEIGETQGLATLEAMSLGVPVVTCSTPWADNAQVEFVQHGRSGLIANHPRPFAEAVAAVLADGDLRLRLQAGARAVVDRCCDPGTQARQLERLFASLLSTGRPPERWSPSAAEVDAFEAEYPRRAREQQRSLRPRERLDLRGTRVREGAARFVRARRSD